MSICTSTQNYEPYIDKTKTGVYIMIYNPTAWNLKTFWIKVPIYINPIDFKNTKIILKYKQSINQLPISYQLVPINEHTKKISERNSTNLANYNLVFNLAHMNSNILLSPLSFSVIYLALNKSSNMDKNPNPPNLNLNLSSSIFAKDFEFKFSIASLQKLPIILIKHKPSGQILKLTIELLYYLSQTKSGFNSGAYTFMPKGNIESFQNLNVQVSY